jgi:hypothetical protein
MFRRICHSVYRSELEAVCRRGASHSCPSLSCMIRDQWLWIYWWSACYMLISNTQTNLDLRNTTLGYGFHFQHRNSGTFPVESLAHDSGRTLAVPNMVIRRDLQIPTVKEEIRRYSSQYSARLSAHPNDLIVNLIALPDNRRLRRHLPNDLPTKFPV